MSLIPLHGYRSMMFVASRLALLLCCAGLVLSAPSPSPSALATFATQHAKPGTQGLVLPADRQLGREVKLGGLDAYVVRPTAAPRAAVVLYTDIYGWRFNNTRVWADKLARQTGYLVVVPDFFRGTAFKEGQSRATLMTWLSGFTRPMILKDTDAILADIRKAYPSVKRIGQQGFCWGGLYSVLLTGAQPRVAAAVGYHASMVQPADLAAVSAPLNLQNADPKLDTQIKPEQYAAFQKVLTAKAAKGLDTSMVYYKDMPHGFTLRGNLTNPATAKAQEESFAAGVKFLKKHLEAKADVAPAKTPAVKQGA